MNAPAIEARMRSYQARIAGVLDSVLPTPDTVPSRLHAAQRYSVLSGGKRLRPLLVYFTGEALQVSPGLLDMPAAAVELIHAYSLVHDDLPAMDDDDLRRGVPTTHRAYDEATAILVGDALQVLAFSLLARTPPPALDAGGRLDPAVPLDPAARLNLIHILADASGTAGMAGGQAIDLQSVGRRLDLAELEAMHRLKTGALIRASVLMAAACAPSVTTGQREALDGYAQDVGLAFQIQDDILDVEGDVAELGKATGADAARDKPTYPSIMGLEAAKLRVQDLKLRACARLAIFEGKAQVLALLAAHLVDRRG